MKLLVVPGHGRKKNGVYDNGAGGYGYNEAAKVRELCNRIKDIGGDSVILGDQVKKWIDYNLYNTVDKSSIDAAIEVHLDSWSNPDSRGGHVIIKNGFSPDNYDVALANFISTYFPGRSETITKKDDLGMLNVCAKRGINARLLETCFITNYDDITKLNNRMDEVATGILASFGIGSGTIITPPPAEKPSTPPPTINPGELSVDGSWGKNTTLRLQQIFGTTQDGVVSNQWLMYKSKNPGLYNGWEWFQRPNGRGSELIKAIQKMCGVSNVDGEIGDQTIKAMQKHFGTTQDGYFSKSSLCIKALQRWANDQ